MELLQDQIGIGIFILIKVHSVLNGKVILLFGSETSLFQLIKKGKSFYLLVFV